MRISTCDHESLDLHHENLSQEFEDSLSQNNVSVEVKSILLIFDGLYVSEI